MCLPVVKSKHLIYSVGLSLVFVGSPVFAYFDPNAGGFLYQLFAPLMAVAISLWVIGFDHLKRFWFQLKQRFDSEKKSGLERDE